MNVNYMSKINYIIEHCQMADVNDKQWKDISVYMKFVNGIDLSTREVHEKNTYDVIKGVIKDKNGENLIKNEIFILSKSKLYSDDEYNIMIYNLLIISLIKYYTNEKNIKQEEGEEELLYNPLKLPFFNNDINSLDNPDSLFQLLIKLIQSENNFRISTYEIILYNIQSIINIFLSKIPKEEENSEIKLKIKQILIQTYDFQIKKIRKLFNSHKHLWENSYDSMLKAFSTALKMDTNNYFSNYERC